MKTRHFVVAAIALSAGTAAFASTQCTDTPKSGWLPEQAMKQKIAEAGYKIDKFKITDGNCYEIYGKDKDGRKVEIYFSPVDGSVVKSKKG